MTKHEVYERVVQLTGELAQAKVAQRIFDAAMQGDAQKTQAIIDAFPEEYSDLYQEIVSFGEKCNNLVGANVKYDGNAMKRLDSISARIMRVAYLHKLIQEFINALDMEDFTKFSENMAICKKENPGLIQEIRLLQDEFTEFFEKYKTGWEIAIFAEKSDEAKGLFVFDPNVIDGLSFYVLCMFGKIDEVRFLYDEYWNKIQIEDDDSEWYHDELYDSIENSTNENFGWFISDYSIPDWIDDEDESPGQILVGALAGKYRLEHEK